MATVYDVPPHRLIERIAAKLRKDGRAEPPAWVALVKTGLHTEKAPVERDWWYGRLAAVLRKVYVNGPIGSSRLAGAFGGLEDRGSKPYHARKGSRAVIRAALKKLEEMELLASSNHRGRVITPAGQKMLDDTAYAILVDLAKDDPEFSKYV